MAATRMGIVVSIAAALLPVLALAQDSKNQGYLVDTFGNNITTSGTGLCWHTSDWTPARSVDPCDPAARKAEAPAPRVAAVSPPPRKPAPAPARMAPQKLNFSADALFDFDKAVLKPEGRAMLDDVARELNGALYEVIFVTGHTDRIGSHEYNRKLSERRAYAVSDYLVSRDVAAHRVKAEGRGETQPVTRSGDCTGPVNSKLIACLQPDRRVHVEVTGTKGVTARSR
ncbi:MAG TPA: OmpA family protein [Burkholderiales bacterium]|nr:OmpA family protein [Burkholderiales bacterium]